MEKSILKNEVAHEQTFKSPLGIFPNPAEPFNPNTPVPPVDPTQPFTPTPFPLGPDTEKPPKDEGLNNTAAIFGQSEEEINKEFRAFKASKLFRKFDYDLTGVYGDDEFRASLDGAVNYGFGSVVVTPQWIIRTRERLKNTEVKVAAAITFPYGEESFGVKTYAAKKAVKSGAKIIFVPCGRSQIKKGNYDALRKEFAKLRKAAKKATVYAVLECGGLTSPEVEKAVNSLVKAGIRDFVTSSGIEPSADASFDIGRIKKSGEHVSVIRCTSSVKGKEVAGMLIAADRVFLKSAIAVARDLKNNLGC